MRGSISPGSHPRLPYFAFASVLGSSTEAKFAMLISPAWSLISTQSPGLIVPDDQTGYRYAIANLAFALSPRLAA